VTLPRPHPRDQLSGTSLKPKHGFGQNFLTDDNHLAAIARLVLLCTKPAAGDKPFVVEFGAGLGALTSHLLDAGASVLAVERDRDLFPLLEKRFATSLQQKDLTLIEGNALTQPLDEVPAGYGLCGNLPYHHAADLCMRCVESRPRVHGGCFLIQLEVAQRIAAGPGTKAYGSLSVVVQSRFDVALGHVVPRTAFWPVPDVDGGVVVMRPRATPHALVEDVPLDDLQRVVRAAFMQRRKTIKNAVSKIPGAVDALEKVGIDKTARAEDVDVGRFIALAHALL
jgi:16S rRNA (adenine1518-N6/adenine1519-N6)-dimethyltransferase